VSEGHSGYIQNAIEICFLSFLYRIHEKLCLCVWEIAFQFLKDCSLNKNLCDTTLTASLAWSLVYF
jgi:hypothetical protein